MNLFVWTKNQLLIIWWTVDESLEGELQIFQETWGWKCLTGGTHNPLTQTEQIETKFWQGTEANNHRLIFQRSQDIVTMSPWLLVTPLLGNIIPSSCSFPLMLGNPQLEVCSFMEGSCQQSWTRKAWMYAVSRVRLMDRKHDRAHKELDSRAHYSLPT